MESWKKAKSDWDRSNGKPHHCKRCGHDWKEKYDHRPSMCPRCQSVNYDLIYPPMYCTLFQGLLAEHLMKILYPGCERMPSQTHGYDYRLDNIKIEVKSSAIHKNSCGTRWGFKTDHNDIADTLILVAFDDRIHLAPQHAWAINARSVNHLGAIYIQNSTRGLDRWRFAEITGEKFNDLCIECDRMRSIGWAEEWAFNRHSVSL